MSIRKAALAVAPLLVSLSLFSGCGGSSDAGRVSIVLSSSAGSVASVASALDGRATSASEGMSDHCGAPQAVSVTFSSILARTLDGKLVDAAIDLPVTVDLLALVNGKEATLPDGFLPPGTYDQFVIVMTQVQLTLANGTKISITPPGGGWTAVVPMVPPFTVAANETTKIALRFRRDLSLGCPSGDWEFHPEFECRDHH